jgi:putative peptidoglycan lipid II flippase
LENKDKIGRAASLIGSATVLSRVLGYGRDMISASLFGASTYSDAFVVAFRLPNLFRDLFAEGALSSAFVPGLARARQQGGEAAAWRLASLMLSALAMVLALVVLAGIWLAPVLLRLAAPGFQADPAQFALALRLTRLLFPFIGFMGMAALLMGTLNARRQFLAPALAPAAMNVVMIAFGLLVCPRLGPGIDAQVTGWALGALAGGAAQWLVQLPAAWRAGFRWRPQWPWRDAGVRRVLGQMGPAVLGLSTTQVNLVVNTMLASQLAAGAVTYLYYGNRLMQLPLGVFGVAIATAVLPDLAAYHAGGDTARFKQTLSFGLRLTLLITLPCLVGLVALALPINVLLLKSGRFDLAAAHATATVSIAYTLGVVFASWVKVLVPAFYALDSPATPVKVSLVMVLANLTLNLALWRRFSYVGLATTASVVALLQALCLLWLMRRRIGPIFKAADAREAVRILVAGLGLGLGLWLARQSLDAWHPAWEEGAGGKGLLLVHVAGLIAGGVLLYAALVGALGLTGLVPERFLPKKARRWAVEAEVAKAQADAYDEA